MRFVFKLHTSKQEGKMFKKKVRRSHSRVVKKERNLKESRRKMLLLRKKGRNSCARIVPKRAMMKRIVGSFILN